MTQVRLTRSFLVMHLENLYPGLGYCLCYHSHREEADQEIHEKVGHKPCKASNLIDSEVIDEDDLNEFQSVLTELDRDVVVNIGSNKDYVSTIFAK